MFILNRQQIATFFLVILLLSILFQFFRIFPEVTLSVYRAIIIPILFLALIFFLKENKIKFKLLSPTLGIALLFVIWVLVTCIFSNDAQSSSSAWFQFIFQYFLISFITFLCIKIAWSEHLFVVIANVMQIIGLILAVSLFLNFFFNIELEVFSSHTDLAYTGSLTGGTFSTILKLAIALSMSMFLFFYYKKKSQVFKLSFSLFASIMCFLALFITGGRLAGILGLFLIFMVAIRQMYSLMKQKPAVFISILAGVVVLCISGLFILDGLATSSDIKTDNKYIEQIYKKIQKYSYAFRQIKTGEIERGSSLGIRLHLFKKSKEFFNEASINYLVFGIGFHQFPKYTGHGFSAENAYSSYFVETGLIGGLLFLALITQIGKTIYRQYRKSENNDFYFYLGIAFLSMVIFFFFEPTLRYTLIWRFFIPLAFFFENKPR